MLWISKPLSATHVRSYYIKEFTAAEQKYWRQGDSALDRWCGRLSAKFGLTGAIEAEEFTRLSDGQHPRTGEQLVRHRVVREYHTADGRTVCPVEHRAGWDATFSAPKSVSLTALVGGDGRVREAHREAVIAALNELERYTQTRKSASNKAEVTGQFVAATFEHDTSRPVNGYAAPHLHTHTVIFNMTARENGSTRALESRGLFESRQFATAIYRSHLTYQLRALGYEIEPGRSGAPEIKGYSQEYLDASSPRSLQIVEALATSGFNGAKAERIAAYDTRDGKPNQSQAEVIAAHRKIGAEFGNQADKLVAEARLRQQSQARERSTAERTEQANYALTYARDRSFERQALVEERALFVEAMRQGRGEITYADLRACFEARISSGEFAIFAGRKQVSGRLFTTAEMSKAEKEIVRRVLDGQGRAFQLMPIEQAIPLTEARPQLNRAQRDAIEQVLTSRDQIQGLQGSAGVGKRITLASIRQGAEKGGYAVEAFSPFSPDARKLRDAAISADFDVRSRNSAGSAQKHLYMIDESSPATTLEVRDLLRRIESQDKVLFIGGRSRHRGGDANKLFERMKQAGMRTAELDEIVRERDSQLLKAVEHLAKNETGIGIRMLRRQGRLIEIGDAEKRIAAIAKSYAAGPGNTIIVTPDHASCRTINQVVHQQLQVLAVLDKQDHSMRVLTLRSDMTGADRDWAARYQSGDVLHYLRGSKKYGIERDSYATVVTTNPRENLITVRKQNGEQVSYHPSQLRGISIYGESEREFAVGDRIQFTESSRRLRVANRDLGTIQRIGLDHRITVRMDDSNKSVTFDPYKMPHFDHGYALTSHSAQGLTAQRVLVNIDTGNLPELITDRFAYVALARGSHQAQIFTNDAARLEAALSRDAAKEFAVDLNKGQRPVAEQLAVMKSTPAMGIELSL